MKVTDIEFQKISPPSDEEVSDARLAHIYEILRQSGIEIKERDFITAKKLLLELGQVAEPTEELTAIVAKLCRHTLEHFITQEAQSLDEEQDGASQERPAKQERSSQRRDDNQGGRDGERGGRENRGRGRERDNDRRGNESRGRGNEQRGRGNDERGPAPAARAAQIDDDQVDLSSGPGNTAEPEPHRTELRVYIGQGTVQGITEDELRKLAVDFAHLSEKDLRHITLRDNHAYVDTFQDQAYALIENLNGIEYNGQTLAVEISSELPGPRNNGHNRPQHRRGDDRRNDRSRGRSRDRDRGNRR